MKRGRKLTVAERNHVRENVSKVENWLISKKESNFWLIIHRATGQDRKILALEGSCGCGENNTSRGPSS